MSYFSPNTNIEEKRKLLYKTIDADSDGNLSPSDLFTFYAKYIFSLRQPGAVPTEGENEDYACIYSDETLTGIVKQIIDMHDLDKDGMLSYKEYCNAVTDWDVREFIDTYFV